MVQVTATEFARNFGRYRDAAQREPVAVTSHDRVTSVLISPEAYEEYERLRRLTTRARFVEELSPQTLEAIRSGTMDSRHDHLNALLDRD